MIVLIYKEEVDNLDMKYIINNFIKHGDVNLENVPRWWESKTESLVYNRIGIHIHNIPSPVLFVHMSSRRISISATYIYR